MVQDARGLFTETTLPDTSYAKDLREKMKRGDVDGMSFGFNVIGERWGTKNGKLYREILDVDLFDVSVVTYPAYSATSAQLRSKENILEAGQRYLAEHRDEIPELEEYLKDLDKYLATISRL